MVSSRKVSHPAIHVRLPKTARYSKVKSHPSADERLAAEGRKLKNIGTAAASKTDKP
jgi:hypothetical protein